MFRSAFLFFCVLCAAILIGCGTTSNSNTSTANSNSAAPTTSTPATTTASTGDKVGIPECDDFLAKYEACVSGKVPEVARAQYQSALKQWRDSWRQMAQNPQTKGTLAAACKQAAEQQATALKQYGCSW